MLDSLMIIVYYFIQLFTLSEILKLGLMELLLSSSLCLIITNYMINTNIFPMLFNFEVIFSSIHCLLSQNISNHYIYFLIYTLYLLFFDKFKMADFVSVNIALSIFYFITLLFKV